MVKTKKLHIDCPICGSEEVFYSCTPMCCFNHVCAECTSTFEPETEEKGGKLSGIEPPDPLPEGSEPTVACANCESTKVYVTEDGSLVCADCGSLLKLVLTEIAPG